MTTVFKSFLSVLQMTAVFAAVAMAPLLAQQAPNDGSALFAQFPSIVSLEGMDSIELLYSAETTFSDRIKALDPAATSEKSVHDYRQVGESWSYEVSKTRNTGVNRQFLFNSDGKVFQEQRVHSGELTISNSESIKNIARWFNPLFEGLSFALEEQYYTPNLAEKYNQINSFSPLICDLQGLSKGGSGLSGFEVDPKLLAEKSLVQSVTTFRKGDEKAPLSSYKLDFESLEGVLPLMVEKRDSAGNLLIHMESSDFKSYGNLRLPGFVKIIRYLDGKIDSTTVVKVDKVILNSPETKIKAIDPSTASRIDDQINKITISPSIFK